MTDQAKISALAAQLERLHAHGFHCCPKWESAHSKTLAALAGVAAEACADDGFYIVKSGSKFLDCDEDGNEIWIRWVWEVICHDWQCGNTMISQHETYHEALIAALKQIESEVTK